MERFLRCAGPAVGLLLAASGRGAEPIAQVEFTDHYTLPIIWDGREIGRRAFEPGKVVQVVRRVGGFLECREGTQTFRVPISVTDYERRAGGIAPPAEAPAPPTVVATPEAALPAASMAPPQIRASATPAPDAVTAPPAAAAPASSRATSPVVEAAPSGPDEYIQAVRRYLQEKPANARHFSYALVRRLAPPSALRQAVGGRLTDPQLPAAERPRLERLKSAFLCYDLGRWTDFEKAVVEADGNR